MKRRGLILLMTGLTAAALAMGCGKKEKSADETATVTEEEPVDEEKKDEKKAGNKEEIKEDEVKIELPSEKELKADYTTAAGIELPAKTRIAVVAKETKSRYWKAVETGMEKAIDDLNAEAGLEGDAAITMTFEGASDSNDAEGQINIVDAVLSENPKALCLAAIDMNSLGAQLEMAEENQIPVTIFDSGVDMNDLVETVCKTDNFKAGQEAAVRLAEAIGGSGKILVTGAQQKTESVSERVAGFELVLEKSYPDISIEEIIYGDDEETQESVADRIKTALDADEEITGCFASDEGVVTEALSVLKGQEYERITFVGFDAGEEQLQAIRNGEELGTVCQNPYGMGYATIIASARAIMGLENEDVIDAGYQWIDATNMDLEENQKYLYE